eukprot:gene12950-7528_t
MEEKEEKKTSLYIRNISHSARQMDLRKLFEKYGEVKDVYIPRDYYTNETRGFAYIEFIKIEDADAAKKDLDGQTFMGRTIEIFFAKGDRKSTHDMRKRSGRSRSPRRDYSRRRYSRSPRRSRRDSRSPRRRRYSRSPRRDSRSPRRDYSRRRDSRSPRRRRDSRSPRRDTKRRDSRSPRRRDSRSPRRDEGRKQYNSRSPRKDSPVNKEQKIAEEIYGE